MRRIVVFLITIFLTITTGCKKNNLTSVSFQVDHHIKEIPMQNIKFQIREICESNDEMVIISEGKTDANGSLTLSFKAKNNGKYQYEYATEIGVSEQYIAIEQPKTKIVARKVQNKIYYTVSESIFCLITPVNENCVSENDKIRFQFKTLNTPNATFSNWREKWGCGSGITYLVKGPYDYYIFEIEVDKGSGIISYSDTLLVDYTPPNKYGRIYLYY